jgi:hypothetical protein
LFLYTGSGGRDLSGNKRTNKEQSSDQKFELYNKSLLKSCERGLPVRVVRSFKEKRSAYAPTDPQWGVRYDGIYRIVASWRIAGNQGTYRFVSSFRRMSGPLRDVMRGTACSWLRLACGDRRHETRIELVCDTVPVGGSTFSRQPTQGLIWPGKDVSGDQAWVPS